MRWAYKISLLLCVVGGMWACSPTKYVGKEEYLLDKVNLSVDGKSLNSSDLKRSIRQKPNTRILGMFRFHLGLYNLSGKDEEKRFNRWLRRIGEAPVIYDSLLMQRSAEQIKLYLRNKGYYSSSVTDTVVYKRKRARVSYRVVSGPRTLVQQVRFQQDSSNRRFQKITTTGLLGNYYRDTVASLIKPNVPLDMDLLDSERERITQMLREKGYFNFSKNFIA